MVSIPNKNFTIQFSDQVREDIKKLLKSGTPGLKNKIEKFKNTLSENPNHGSLGSHKLKNQEFESQDVWMSYLQNNAPNALRARWIYLENDTIEVIEILTHNRY